MIVIETKYTIFLHRQRKFIMFLKVKINNIAKIVKTTLLIYMYIILEVNSQTKYEFYIFIETLQIVSSMCSL